MKLISFNLRFGGQKRTPQIIDYLLKEDADLLVLTEFMMNDNGGKIIQKISENGYKTKPSNDDGSMGSFIASKNDFHSKSVFDRWTEVYFPENDLYVLGVYVPDQPGEEKNLFWNKMLEYAENNIQENVLITGDFNSCTKEDSSNATEYYAKQLMELEEMEYIDMWKKYSKEGSPRYTWFYHSGDGFRLDYAFISPKLAASIDTVIVYHDFKVRETKISDHLPVILEFNPGNIGDFIGEL